MRGLITLLLLIIGLCVQATGIAADKSVIAVIVPHDNAHKTISLGELKLIYWRKKTYWGNGQPIHPINLPSDNALRLQFSTMVLGSPPSAQNDYWNGLYFHGTTPPHVLYSDEAAIRYVQETAGSIAYADACKLDNRVKPLLWLLPNGDITSNPAAVNCNER